MLELQHSVVAKPLTITQRHVPPPLHPVLCLSLSFSQRLLVSLFIPVCILCIFASLSFSFCLGVYRYIYLFSLYILNGFIFIFLFSATPERPVDGTVPSLVATQLEADRGCHRGQGEVPDSNWESLHRNQASYH
jgi:hypothetical protein